MGTNTTRLSVTASAVQNPPDPPLAVAANPLMVQGGISIAVILAITLFVKALAELIRAAQD